MPERPTQTIVFSDLHLSDAEPDDPRRPMWRAFRQRAHFVDADVIALVQHALGRAEAAGEHLELVLNGDVFDFDPIMAQPDPPASRLHWLARLRGLGTEQWMSAFKMGCILKDHGELMQALGEVARRGHTLVFVVGNHDLELYWPDVQWQVRQALQVGEAEQANVRFCEWFYLSNADTYISHGHLQDPYCTVPDPVHPLISVGGEPRVRLPFGDVANRYMLNGMGYFNPHATANYIMTATEYVAFFFRYMFRTHPQLLWTWFWSAHITAAITLAEFIRPALRDPLTVEQRVDAIAERARATPAMVRQLAAATVPSACTNPLMIMRELWLDRGLLFVAMVYAAWQLVLAVNFLFPISPFWVLLPFGLLFPLFLQYSFHVKPETFAKPLLDDGMAEQIRRITGAQMAVLGHTHQPTIETLGPLQVCNVGFWSPAFAEPECKRRIGTQTFAWIRPLGGGQRHLQLWEWPPGAAAPLPYNPAAAETVKLMASQRQ
ncbi:MAG: metallophosphoesterase [Deltaproteobacteria bacterium]|nr:metallophosphoesterase [Deltaproteobacteria bacterium]